MLRHLLIFSFVLALPVLARTPQGEALISGLRVIAEHTDPFLFEELINVKDEATGTLVFPSPARKGFYTVDKTRTEFHALPKEPADEKVVNEMGLFRTADRYRRDDYLVRLRREETTFLIHYGYCTLEPIKSTFSFGAREGREIDRRSRATFSEMTSEVVPEKEILSAIDEYLTDAVAAILAERFEPAERWELVRKYETALDACPHVGLRRAPKVRGILARFAKR